jgi:hypothetical protein
MSKTYELDQGKRSLKKRRSFSHLGQAFRIHTPTIKDSWGRTLFAWLISHQPAVFFSQNEPATSNQPIVLFSQNKSAPTTSHQPNEQAACLSWVIGPLLSQICGRRIETIRASTGTWNLVKEKKALQLSEN